ncbi:MAG TPA: hypothetical protein VFR86_11065 [Burkholderiaceae bacterium]|nr:hypothetical protein [Burkholderiaceae bacterium]
MALAEMHEDFIAEAEQAATDIDAGGVLYAAEDVRAYVVSLAKGAKARRPRPLPAKATTRRAKSRRSA